MPIIRSSFQPPWFLRNGHLQTILPVLLARSLAVPFVAERLELPDGDFLDLDWLKSGCRRVAVLTHGLEGNTNACYIRGTALALRRAGWDALAWNFRGCGSEPNRLVRAYHSGETGDLGCVIRHAAAAYQEIALVGFSLGGNVTLKYLGEAAPNPAVSCAVAISTPVDLAASARALDRRRRNRVYLRRFMKTLVAKMEEKARCFPDELDVSHLSGVKTFEQFDDRFTGPLHGFRDAIDYWNRCSSRQFLPAIRTRTLLLNARNDPFLTPECFPVREAENNPALHLEMPESGGHVGFLDFKRGLHPWSERRIVEFLSRIRKAVFGPAC